MMLCVIWYHLYSIKNVKNTHVGVILLISMEPNRESVSCYFTTMIYIRGKKLKCVKHPSPLNGNSSIFPFNFAIGNSSFTSNFKTEVSDRLKHQPKLIPSIFWTFWNRRRLKTYTNRSLDRNDNGTLFIKGYWNFNLMPYMGAGFQ